jgi:hypothetical protein
MVISRSLRFFANGHACQPPLRFAAETRYAPRRAAMIWSFGAISMPSVTFVGSCIIKGSMISSTVIGRFNASLPIVSAGV